MAKNGRNPNDRVQFLLKDLQNNVERMKETLSNEEVPVSIQPEVDPESDLMRNNDLSSEPKIEKYPEVSDMKRSIINGTFDWSKTAKSILFLKKHQCSDSLLRESLRNETFSSERLLLTIQTSAGRSDVPGRPGHWKYKKPHKEIFFIGAVLRKSRQYFKPWEVVIQRDGIPNVDLPPPLKISCRAFYIIIVLI